MKNILNKKNNFIGTSIQIIFLLYFWWLLHPLFIGQSVGTLHHSDIPQEYIQVKDFLVNQQTFYRVLWIPVPPKYVFYTDIQRSVSAQELLNIYNQKELLNKFKAKDTEKLLQEANVRYVIIPDDTEKQIYITDRKYDNSKYNELVKTLSIIPWLKRLKSFGNVIVFQVPDQKDHFWIDSPKAKVSYKAISPVEYKVDISNAKKGDRLVFAEGFDPHWVAKIISSKYKVPSIKYDKLLNSFILPEGGNYTLDVYYTPQKWVNIGIWISLGTLVLAIGSLIILRRKT